MKVAQVIFNIMSYTEERISGALPLILSYLFPTAEQIVPTDKKLPKLSKLCKLPKLPKLSKLNIHYDRPYYRLQPLFRRAEGL